MGEFFKEITIDLWDRFALIFSYYIFIHFICSKTVVTDIVTAKNENLNRKTFVKSAKFLIFFTALNLLWTSTDLIF